MGVSRVRFGRNALARSDPQNPALCFESCSTITPVIINLCICIRIIQIISHVVRPMSLPGAAGCGHDRPQGS